MQHPPHIRPICLSLLAVLLMAPASPAQEVESESWKPGDTSEGPGFRYQIFARDGNGTMRYQARGVIEAEPAALVAAVRQVASDPERAPDGQTRRIVSKGDEDFVVYTYIDLPTFFSDRDIVTRGVSTADSATGTHRIDWSAIEHEEVPRKGGTIRISRSAGFWEFAPEGEGASTVVYETYVDLGGSLPGWLIQPMMKSMVGETYEDVAQEALGGD